MAGRFTNVVKRRAWPGEAAVIVSVVHVAKGMLEVNCSIDGRDVNEITSYLFHSGGDDPPIVLAGLRRIVLARHKPS